MTTIEFDEDELKQLQQELTEAQSILTPTLSNRDLVHQIKLSLHFVNEHLNTSNFTFEEELAAEILQVADMAQRTVGDTIGRKADLRQRMAYFFTVLHTKLQPDFHVASPYRYIR